MNHTTLSNFLKDTITQSCVNTLFKRASEDGTLGDSISGWLPPLLAGGAGMGLVLHDYNLYKKRKKMHRTMSDAMRKYIEAGEKSTKELTRNIKSIKQLDKVITAEKTLGKRYSSVAKGLGIGAGLAVPIGALMWGVNKIFK